MRSFLDEALAVRGRPPVIGDELSDLSSMASGALSSVEDWASSVGALPQQASAAVAQGQAAAQQFQQTGQTLGQAAQGISASAAQAAQAVSQARAEAAASEAAIAAQAAQMNATLAAARAEAEQTSDRILYVGGALGVGVLGLLAYQAFRKK